MSERVKVEVDAASAGAVARPAASAPAVDAAVSPSDTNASLTAKGVDLSDDAQWREIEHDRRAELRLIRYAVIAMSFVSFFVVVRLLFF